MIQRLVKRNKNEFLKSHSGPFENGMHLAGIQKITHESKSLEFNFKTTIYQRERERERETFSSPNFGPNFLLILQSIC